jgi:hypothetical protein
MQLHVFYSLVLPFHESLCEANGCGRGRRREIENVFHTTLYKSKDGHDLMPRHDEYMRRM